MRRAALSFAVFALLVAGFSTAATAAVYTITLNNGATFESRYPPERASWDASKVVFLTDFANRIAFLESDIASVAVDTETRGFGYQIDTATMALGWSPNDALDPDSEEGQKALAAQVAADAYKNALPPVYNQQQFVEPSATSGMPLWMTMSNAVPQLQPQPIQP
jgi:hypothetical protein